MVDTKKIRQRVLQMVWNQDTYGRLKWTNLTHQKHAESDFYGGLMANTKSQTNNMHVYEMRPLTGKWKK